MAASATVADYILQPKPPRMDEVSSAKSGSVDFYKVLGVSQDASIEEIAKAWKLAVRYKHPDKNGGTPADFQELNRAHEVLSDPKRRAHYDQERKLISERNRRSGFACAKKDVRHRFFQGVPWQQSWSFSWDVWSLEIRMEKRDGDVAEIAFRTDLDSEAWLQWAALPPKGSGWPSWQIPVKHMWPDEPPSQNELISTGEEILSRFTDTEVPGAVERHQELRLKLGPAGGPWHCRGLKFRLFRPRPTWWWGEYIPQECEEISFDPREDTVSDNTATPRLMHSHTAQTSANAEEKAAAEKEAAERVAAERAAAEKAEKEAEKAAEEKRAAEKAAAEKAERAAAEKAAEERRAAEEAAAAEELRRKAAEERRAAEKAAWREEAAAAEEATAAEERSCRELAKRAAEAAAERAGAEKAAEARRAAEEAAAQKAANEKAAAEREAAEKLAKEKAAAEREAEEKAAAEAAAKRAAAQKAVDEERAAARRAAEERERRAALEKASNAVPMPIASMVVQRLKSGSSSLRVALFLSIVSIVVSLLKLSGKGTLRRLIALLIARARGTHSSLKQ